MGCFRLREAADCFRFDEQEVHMHSTKNVNETHSTQFLMETSSDLGIRRWRKMGSPYTPPRGRKKKSLQHEGGNDSSDVKRKKVG